MKLNITPQFDEAVGGIIHNHFDCPACNTQFADSNVYDALYDAEPPVLIGCEHCGAEFQLVSGEAYHDGDWIQVPLPTKGSKPCLEK
jgi:hypothetical protein